MLEIAIPGREVLRADHLLLDINGTLTVDGVLLPGVAERLAALSPQLHIVLLTADTFGTARSVADELGLELRVLAPGDGGPQKEALVRALGSCGVIAIGNGANDARMLQAAALGIAVVQAEGATAEVIRCADVVFGSICDALDAVRSGARLAATLRP